MMARYTGRYINIISLIISVIIFGLINNLKIDIPNVKFKASFNVEQNNAKQDKESIQSQEKVLNDIVEDTKEESNINQNWYIKVPSISLNAQIAEGTNAEILDKFVGHFEDTSKENGNIGLAAHNRGYENNYFSGLKSLKDGEEILYKHNDFYKVYVVTKHEIIKDTDWSNLENTDVNTITLITCVENEPEYRRCIQGIEKN